MNSRTTNAMRIQGLIAGSFLAVGVASCTDTTTPIANAAKSSSTGCVNTLPATLKTTIDSAYQGWKVLDLSDLVSDDQQIWKSNFKDSCPGVAVGNFRSAGNTSYAIALVRKTDSGQEEKVVLADAANNSYNLVELQSEKIQANFAVVRKGPPGQYKDFYDRTKPVTVNNDAVVYEHLEASAIAFYSSGDTFKKVLISD